MASSSSSSGRSTILCSLLLMALFMMPLPSPTTAQLTTGFYATTCPNAFDIIRAGVRSAVNREARMGASLLRLHFHDCFVNGCDAGVLIDGADGEQAAAPNANSLRGFNVISSIKAQLNTACGNVVSCADVLAVAARDSVVELGGPTYQVPVGRRDARTSSQSGANNELPGFSDDLATLTSTFTNKGFTQRDLVALSGAHTIGFAQCATFRDRIYNDTNIDPTFATARRANCPNNGGNTNLAPLDAQSPNRFGNNYFQALMSKRGLLHSDQVLFDGGATDSIVRSYSTDANAFNTDFGSAMVKMGNMSPLTGTQGEIRTVCNKIN